MHGEAQRYFNGKEYKKAADVWNRALDEARKIPDQESRRGAMSVKLYSSTNVGT